MESQSRIVVVLSFALESNVFNPEPRKLESFQYLAESQYEQNERQAGFVRRLQAAHPDLFSGVTIKFGCLYRGFCGGLIPAEDFATMKRTAAQTVKKILAGRPRLDGVFFDLHGAMGAEGSCDVEAELVETVRDSVPIDLVSASFDFHGNFSARLAASLDLVTAYKTFPHIDMEETKTKGLYMLLSCLQHAIRPAVVIVLVPAILPGDTVVTTEGPGRELYRWLRDLEPSEWQTRALAAPEMLGPAVNGHTVNGLMDASFFVGHGLADEPRVGAAVVLTGTIDSLPALAPVATSVAQWYWDRRREFDYPVGSPLVGWDAAITQIYESFDGNQRILVGDLGDNVNAGASGDVPFVCRSLLALTSAHRAQGQPRVLIAGLVDKGAVEACAAAVVASRPCLPQISIGASHAVGASYGDGCERLMLRDATVLGMVNDGAWAVLEASEHVTIVLQRAAWAFFGPNDIELLTSSFNPANYDVVVFKRGNVESLAFAMLPSLPPVDHPGASLEARPVVRSTRCLMARTPGATAYPMPPRPHLRPRMFPLCDEREWVPPLGICPAHDKEGNLATSRSW